MRRAVLSLLALVALASVVTADFSLSKPFLPNGECNDVDTYSNNARLREYFETMLNADGVGGISLADLRAHVLTLGDDPATLEEEVLVEAIRVVDADGDGEVSFEEFGKSFCRMLDRKSTGKREAVPEQVHMSLTTDPTCMVFIWVTFEETPDSQVQYGRSPGQYPNTVEGIQYTYNVGVTGWFGFLHKVRVCGLTPEQWYYYRVGSSGANAWSKEFDFHAVPAIGRPSRAMRYLIFGDMGTFMPCGLFVTDAIAAWHEKEPFDMTLHLGDISYAGTGSEREWEIVWDIYQRQTEVFAAYYPYMTTMGNHEKYYNFTAYRNRFQMPGDETGGVDNFYFSFDYGLVHSVSLCSEDYAYPWEAGSAQYNWARADLQKAVANRHNVPWIIVSFHRPFYGTTSSGSWEGIRQVYEPLLKEFNVDIYFAGHIHAYERTLPMYDHQVVNDYPDRSLYTSPQAPVHITIGTAGAMIADRWVSEPDWLVFRQRSFGFGFMTVHNATALTWTFVSNLSEGVADEFTIVK